MTRNAPRPAVLLTAAAVVLAGTVLAAGCSAATSGPSGGTASGDRATSQNGTAQSVAPTPVRGTGTLGEDFADHENPPAPEATINPAPGSWDDVAPPADYRVVLLSPGDPDAETETLVDAVESWAEAEDVTVVPVVADTVDDRLPSVATAIGKRSDLVISVGDDMVDPIAAISPSALHQQFLVLGAEIAEPTSNVTAADWTGAGFRGEGLGVSSHHDPSTFTDERAGRALRAGVAAALNGFSGIVVWVP
ncbi:hypothetical protein [Curtobacterium sp. MCSS17_015]|uniref:hypothetical protein n=1 Tax=Curtobacterium sp. MCSS17_015 TaxID=2175666 RepID=UPI000DA96A4A|nr:hypothetical protein [Curtobacterium sp. MCSS17_015]WIB25976.1 hypothetical protein DEJ18_13100 [Curtobacterium sp. MCSS17_015]